MQYIRCSFLPFQSFINAPCEFLSLSLSPLHSLLCFSFFFPYVMRIRSGIDSRLLRFYQGMMLFSLFSFLTTRKNRNERNFSIKTISVRPRRSRRKGKGNSVHKKLTRQVWNDVRISSQHCIMMLFDLSMRCGNPLIVAHIYGWRQLFNGRVTFVKMRLFI